MPSRPRRGSTDTPSTSQLLSPNDCVLFVLIHSVVTLPFLSDELLETWEAYPDGMEQKEDVIPVERTQEEQQPHKRELSEATKNLPVCSPLGG